MIRPATHEEHAAILAIAKQHRCTRDFGSHMFSSPAMYEKGWIRVYDPCDGPLAFTCRRDKVREPVTELYFIGVAETARGTGIGELMMEDLYKVSPHKRIGLNVLRTNEVAIRLYTKHGFEVVSETALKGEGLRMEKQL